MSGERCAYCGREVSVCWVMPCFVLENALKSGDEAELSKWARASGVGLKKGEEVLVQPSK